MQGEVDFEREVIAHSREQPVLVDFWASWCAPCRALGPILERLATRSKGRFKLVKIDTERQPELATRYGVYSIPAVKLFSDGEPIAEFVGAQPEAAVARWLEQNLPTPSRQTTAEAEEALAAGDLDKARQLLTQAVELDPENQGARVALARTYLPHDPSTATKLIDRISAEAEVGEQAEAIRTLARLPSLLTQTGPTPDEAWRDYLDGIRAYAEGDNEHALSAWIAAMRKSRTIDEDGPRRAAIALFHLLGEDHELTLTFRRQLASALY